METEPYREPPALAALRFLLELVAWVAIYFAWGWIGLVLAVAAVALFSVPGDKHLVVVRVSGRIRIAIEVLLAIAGVAAVHRVWAIPSASAVFLAFALLFVASRRRMRWLWQH